MILWLNLCHGRPPRIRRVGRHRLSIRCANPRCDRFARGGQHFSFIGALWNWTTDPDRMRYVTGYGGLA